MAEHKHREDEMHDDGPRRKRRRGEHGRMHEKHEGSLGHSAMGRGHSTPLINPKVTDRDAYVRRTYTSNGTISVFNTNTQPYTGFGFSLHFTYDTAQDTCDTEIYLGSPQAGIGNATSLRFENLADEFQSFSEVFRYFRVSKFQASVSKLPMPVYMPSQPIMPPSVPSEQQQGGSWTNMGDPGRLLLRPWSGAPNIAAYTNGVLTATDWGDHNRVLNAKIESACGHIDHPLKLACKPIQPVIIPDTTDPEDAGSQVRFDVAPAIDFANFKTGIQDASAYGIIFYWYFPACVGAITGLLNTDIQFDIEVEYFGLKPPTGYTPPAPVTEGAVYNDSKEMLIAASMGEKVKGEAKPPRPPLLKVSVGDLESKKEEDDLSTAMSDTVIVSSQPKKAALAKVPNQQAAVPTPNNTPRKK